MKKMNADEMMAKAMGMLMAGDIEGLSKMNAELDAKIAADKEMLEAMTANDPVLSAIVGDLLGSAEKAAEESANEFLESIFGVSPKEVKPTRGTRAATLSAEEVDVDDAFLAMLLGLGKEEEEKSSKEDMFKDVKQSALAKHPEMAFVMELEKLMLGALSPQERIEYLHEKYSSLHAGMMAELDKVDDEMALGIAGGLAAYEMVIEDLAGLLKK